jgi:uncharacterized protein YndB with AHSA1/START domain
MAEDTGGNQQRIGDEAVRAKTGKSWSEWYAVLDAAGCRQMDHTQIAEYVYGLGVPGWWAQMVAVGYEQERGLRVKHQNCAGYAVGASKTVNVPVSRLFEAWTDADLRRQWLGEAQITIRKATPDKSLRITWEDGKSSVEVNLYAKGDTKSQVAVDHGKLPDLDEATRMKAYWGEKVSRLKQLLEQPG